MAQDNIADAPSCVFFAIADWGNNTAELCDVAACMNHWAVHKAKPMFVTALGDNFYPKGVRSVADPAFHTLWWSVFLQPYPSLRVPWKVILGNHDYMGNWQAQVDFTTCKQNVKWGGFWQMEGRNYTFTSSHLTSNADNGSPTGPSDDSKQPPSSPESLVQFFALDSNGCQGHVQTRYPYIKKELHENIDWLESSLAQSSAKWRIVLAHHPMYTQSRKHGVVGRCLRDHKYGKSVGDESWPGFGLEDVVVKGGVSAYITGHEHMFQHHAGRGGVHHCVIGASGAEENRLYGGADKKASIDWLGHKHFGFLVGTVTKDSLKLEFVSVLKDKHGQVVHTVTIPAPTPCK